MYLVKKRRVLYVVHNHPGVRPGGAETYALELYEAARAADQFEPLFLARTGPPISNTAPPADGRLIHRINGDPHQFFLYTDGADYDRLYGTARDKDFCVHAFADFLRDQQPAIVHFQHTHFLGYDLIQQVKTTLPDARIIYTLHEFLPICHNNGQMVRTHSAERCTEASPARCHECFPDISTAHFFLRERFIQAQFALVDLFLAPSRFLLERFVAWGLPREKIVFEEYGRELIAPRIENHDMRPYNRLGFFGQFSPYKGVDVLLRAAALLASETVDFHLWLHGANLDLQHGKFREEFHSLVETNRIHVTLAGAYGAADVAGLMAAVDWIVVPSIWWENSPLVIQEAFMNRRPVICSNIGGMAEKVAPGANGLHFQVGDPTSLASVLRRAVTTPGLCEELQAGIPAVYPIADSVQRLTGLYEELLR
jgi:glycosyltransferase involved in cell wall biosynthesis